MSLSVPGTDCVRVRTNQPYGPGDARHVYDAYLPLDAKGPAAVVLLVHGGVGDDVPYRPKDWGIYRSWGRLLAASGFVAIAFNHRLGFPHSRLDAANEDVSAMLETVRQQAKALQADPQRVAAVAFSAGGSLLTPFLREPVPGVRCLGAFYPFLDLRPSKLHRQYLDAAALARHSPAAQLRNPAAQAMPFFLARAGRDAIPYTLASMPSSPSRWPRAPPSPCSTIPRPRTGSTPIQTRAPARSCGLPRLPPDAPEQGVRRSPPRALRGLRDVARRG